MVSIRGRPKLVVCAVLLLAVGAAHAGPYVPQGPFVDPIPGSGVPWPWQVPGKEYSDHLDKDGLGRADPLQVIMWDGVGGVADTFDYSGSWGAGLDPGDEVDALANHGDALYHAVIRNQAALLFSVGSPAPCLVPGSAQNIYYETIGGGGGIWATPAQIDQHGVNDVDGLEVWGPEQIDDSDRFSLAGDPGLAGGPKVAVWAFAGGASTPWLWDSQIQQALLALGISLDEVDIDLDAMMTWDVESDGGYFDVSFGDSIMFSLAPAGGLDGGEIFVWDAAGLRYLWHGGHLWDTAFDVMGTFGLDCENVNALEAVAVPEPLTLLGAMMGIGGLMGYVRKRVRQ